MSIDCIHNKEKRLSPLSNNLGIEPYFETPLDLKSFYPFLQSIEKFLPVILPEDLQQALENAQNDQEATQLLHQFLEDLPFFHHSPLEKAPCTISITGLCKGEYTSGVGRYFSDILSRWLIPGKQLLIVGARSLSFQFVKCKKQPVFFFQQFLKVFDPLELEIIKQNLPKILQEIRINILAVYYARYIVSVKSLSLEQKTVMIQEQIKSLFNSPEKENDSNIFDQMQQFLIKLSAEDKFKQIKDNISYLVSNRPKAFDRDVFYEIRGFMSSFRDKFTASRDPRHVSRVIAYQYLFKKNILSSLEKKPHERFLSIKLLRTHLASSSKTIGLLIALNFIRETERFEKKHIIEAAQAILPQLTYVKDSYVQERSEEKIRTYYLELEKSSFTKEEVKKLRKYLPKEIKARFENVIHPIFMPRNEEELMRNMILLSKQLKFIKDLPQAIISYDRQTDEELSFQVILARLVRNNEPPLEHLLQHAEGKFLLDEVKNVGVLKRKYPKEVAVFHLFLKKQSFFRKDFSLDLQKARYKVVQILMECLGEFRDFNGGMILKQGEALNSLRSMLFEAGNEHEFLLENFFYSLKPAFMQSILDTEILKSLFLLFLESLEFDFSVKPYFFKTETFSRYCLIMIGTTLPNLKKEILQEINKLSFPSGHLTIADLNTYEINTLGFVQRIHCPKTSGLVLETISKVLRFYQKKL